MNSQKELLLEIAFQNMITNGYALDSVSNENIGHRLNTETASIGFISRHIGATMNWIGYFHGVSTDNQNTTLGQQDTGKGYKIETSK